MANLVTHLSSISVFDLNPTAQTPEPAAKTILIDQFNTTNQSNLFKNLKQKQFTGQLIFWDQQGTVSIFYLFHGRIFFATGGHHANRRWTRNLMLHGGEMASELNSQQENQLLSLTLNIEQEISWQYQFLCEWVKQRKISREQVFSLIRGLLNELLFDLTQATQVTYLLKPVKFATTPLILINPEEVILDVWKLWQVWQKNNLADYSPNLAPIIRKPQQLKSQILPAVYQVLQQSLDGKSSLRDLSLLVKQDLLSLTKALFVYVQWGLVEFVEIEDLSGPVDLPTEIFRGEGPIKGHLVAYIDDNLEMCQRMKQITIPAGYQCLTIQNPSEAIPLCLAQNPAIIIINAQMSSTNGYRICQQLRQIPFFRDTPIIMLADQVSLMDKLRAKVSGIGKILPKLAEPNLVTATLFNYLAQESVV